MAYATNTAAPIHHRDIYAVLDGWLDTLKLGRQRRRVYRQTMRELSCLNDRELNDIGLSRSQVQDVSLKAAMMIR